MSHKQLKYIDAKGKNKEQLIRSQTPIHSKSVNKNWYDNYDRIFKRKVGGMNHFFNFWE